VTRTLIALLGLSFGLSTTALADDEGIPVTVQVADTLGNPIPTAIVRHPAEQDRHRVNTETGKWMAQILYLPDGSELVFVKGMELEFEISAPGYQNAHVTYLVRKRKNVVPVVLEKMDLDALMADDDDDEEPMIQFGRDKPID
jgi:hypothetical protein